MNEEIAWAASRPESRWKNAGQGHDAQLPCLEEDGSEAAFESTLTQTEHEFYLKYIDKFGSMDVFSLNQDPNVKPMRSKHQALGQVVVLRCIILGSNPMTIVRFSFSGC